MFTRQHYIAIADAISTEYQQPYLYDDQKRQMAKIIDALVDLFIADNPRRFNESLFLKACGYDQDI